MIFVTDWSSMDKSLTCFAIVMFCSPLTKKLKECGVFGVSSDEYLNYAKSNRKEWELKGKGIVSELMAAQD